MRLPRITGVILGCALACGASMVAQSTTTSHSSGGQSANPFPEAQSEAAAKAAHNKDKSQQPSAPSTTSHTSPQSAAPSSGPKGKQSSPAADNPFPEAQSEAAASKDSQSASQAKSGSSSGGGYSSSSQDLPPADVGQGKVHANANGKEDTYTMDKHPKTRIKNDLNVADFYFKNGNYRGAYLRYQDTLKYDPVNETALFGSAMAMCKQNLTEDALHSFRQYLQLYPEGKYTKKAAGMVAHPDKCMHNR